MVAFKNVHIVLPERIIFDGILLAEDGKIIEFDRADKVSLPLGTNIVDGKGGYLAPGFVDIHTHAGGGIWFYDDPEKAAKAHLEHGTTSITPALYFNLNQQQFVDGIRLIREKAGKGSCRVIRGLYLEGPYLNPKFGCDAENNRWTGAINAEEYMPILEAAAGFAKVVCVAPEREGIEVFVSDTMKLMPGVKFAVAHSEASPQQIENMIPAGLCIATHHTNATGDRPRYPECRGVCVDEAVNYNHDIYAELICDEFGIHVDPYMLRLVRKIKGDDRLILVSDACVFDGPVPPGYDGVTDINFDYAGEIAGSKLTLDCAARNMMRHTGAGICDVFRFAATNPAKAVGLLGRGEIRRGYAADLIITDHLMNIQQVFLEGNKVY